MIGQNIVRPWPEEVKATLASFKQGDLVKSPPFFYYANPRHALWQLSCDEENPEPGLVEVEEEDRPIYGLITSQTCDLNEQRPEPQQPWIKIAPVYNLEGVLDGGRVGQVTQHRIGHLVKLTGPALPSGLWVADLRVEFPVEKGWLVGREPIAGFGDEAGFFMLARRLARRSDRPALANSVSDGVVNHLRAKLNKMNRAKQTRLLDDIREFRLSITGDRLAPTTARLMVITHNVMSMDIKEWFDEWWQEATHECNVLGLVLMGNRYETMDSLSAAEYDSAILLDFDYLSPND